MVGYHQTGTIFEVDHHGVLTVLERDFHAIGTGWPHAHLVHQTLTAINIKPPPDVRLHVITTLAARSAPQCQPPVFMGRVSDRGFESVPNPP